MLPRSTGKTAVCALQAGSSKNLIASRTCSLKILDLAHRLTSLAELTRCGSIHTLSSTNPPAKEYEYLPFAISGDSPVMGKVVVETVLDKCLRDGIYARKLKLPETNYFKNSTPVPFATKVEKLSSNSVRTGQPGTAVTMQIGIHNAPVSLSAFRGD